MRELRGMPLPASLSTVPLSWNFFNSLYIINTILYPAFLRIFVNLFAVYPVKYKLLIKILSWYR